MPAGYGHIRYAAFMRISPLEHESGKLVALEMPIIWSGRHGLCRKVSRVPGVAITRRPKLMSWLREESFCQFSLNGVDYEILEPFGDNTHYWLAPLDANSHDETLTLLEHLSTL
jgi:hypothetical protein